MKVRKKGFTITELVIVIAVIAILAAVLIPTFSNVIEKANESAASSACNIAVTEYITMVTLDSDPDNNDATGVVFSNDNYYYVYSGGKLHYIGNTEKDSDRLLAVTSFDTDISALTGFNKQPADEGVLTDGNKLRFTIGGKDVEIDFSDSTRTLYLYNVDINGTTHAGFFTINNTYGGSGNVIQTVNYSYECGISQDEVTMGQVEVTEEIELVLESISAEYLSSVAICVGDTKIITPEEVKVTATYQGNIKQLLSANLYTLDGAEIDTTSVGERIVTVIYSEDTSITTQFSVNVTEKQTRTYYFFNSNNWQTPHAYVWREEYISVKPAVGDFVLMGNILGEENAWTVDGSVKMFYNSSSGEYVVKGLRIANGQQFKIGKVTSADRTDIWTLNSIETNENTQWTVQVPAQDAGFTAALVGNEKNIVLNAESETYALYDIYWKSNNVLYIAKSTDQTAENQPNVAIISTYPNEWPGVPMEPATDKGTGWWQIDIDTRAQFVVFNDGSDDDNNKTGDIAFDGNPDNVYYCNGGWTSSVETTTYYFYNARGWEKVYAHYWTEGGPGTAWHGVEMTAVEGQDGWFSIEVDDNFKNIVFNDGIGEIEGVNKTADLTLNSSTPYFDGYEWKSEQTTHQHSGGTATCLELATCEVCGQQYGELGSHTLQHVEGVQPTCTESGIIEHWKCTLCEKLFSDSGAENEITDVTAPATGHTPGSEWKSDENYHWNICSVCNGEVNKVAHTWDKGTVTTEPTCTTAGVKTFKCECGATKTEEIPMLEHVYDQTVATEEYLATAATCTDKATYYYSCVCGAKGTETFESGEALGHLTGEEWFADGTNHWKQCIRCETHMEEAAHTGGIATCSEQATCEICNHQYGELGEHNFVNNVCQNCSAVRYYFYNFAKWDNVCAYAWADPAVEGETATEYLGAFPGKAMIADTENAGWYYIVVDGDARKIIFNNGKDDANRQQSNDIELDVANTYYCILGWKDTPDISDIIVLDLTVANNWRTASPRFAVYLFNDNEQNVWLDMTSIAYSEYNGVKNHYYYAVDISNLEFVPTMFIVCRMKSGTIENNWDNKWNQTANLLISNGLYVKIPADYWDGEIGGNQSTIGV